MNVPYNFPKKSTISKNMPTNLSKNVKFRKMCTHIFLNFENFEQRTDKFFLKKENFEKIVGKFSK